MSSPTDSNPLQAWLQRHHSHHPDIRYLRVPCSDAKGLFWRGRYLYQQPLQKPWQGRFVKRMDYQDIDHFNIKRIDGTLPAPAYLYPRQLPYSLALLVVIMVCVMGMVLMLRHMPASFWPWIYPIFISMVFLNAHEQFLLAVFKLLKTNQHHETSAVPINPWLKWLKRFAVLLLRCVFLILFVIYIGMPVTEWLHQWNQNTLDDWFQWAVVYFVTISMVTVWLARKSLPKPAPEPSHYFVLQLQLKDGQSADFAYAKDETILQQLKAHLSNQHPRLQDAHHGQTQA